MVLIHWPGTAKLRLADPRNAINRAETYKALLKARNKGLVKSIGVSNYTVRHLQELPELPAVNQVEMHPLYPQRELIAYCESNVIKVQSYANLGEGNFVNGTIDLPSLSIEGRTKAQVLLKWALSKGCLVIPKASAIDRLRENINLDFDLIDNQITAIDAEIKTHGERKFCWDPTSVE